MTPNSASISMASRVPRVTSDGYWIKEDRALSKTTGSFDLRVSRSELSFV